MVLSAADRAFFKTNGYLVKQETLTAEQISRAQDALWEGIEADRDDAETWIDAGPRAPVPGNHPDIHATLHDSPIFSMAEELVGKGLLGEDGSPGPALVYPSRSAAGGLAEDGHLDGYYTPTNGVPQGTVSRFTIGATIYVDQVEAGGGGFIIWPGSHAVAAEYFRTHSLLSIEGGSSRGVFDLAPPVEITGPAGTVCFWHGQLVHSGSTNTRNAIRMALIVRLSRLDILDIMFETPDDMWQYWEGVD
jgi:hypothetical protein